MLLKAYAEKRKKQFPPITTRDPKKWLVNRRVNYEELYNRRDKRSMADKIGALERRLKEVKEKFDELKKSGIDEDILVVYLQSKTRLSKADIKGVLHHTEDFFNKLVSEEVAENI